jgi:hypothetical protein
MSFLLILLDRGEIHQEQIEAAMFGWLYLRKDPAPYRHGPRTVNTLELKPTMMLWTSS